MTLVAGSMKYRYEGNGVTDVFSYPTKVFDESYIVVKLIDRTTGADVETLTITTDYTVTITSTGTGTVTITNATKIPSASEDLLLNQEIPITQDTAFPSGTAFPSAANETGLDKVTALIQTLSDKVDRSIIVSENEVIGDTTLVLPTAGLRALKYVAFDAAGDIVTTSGAGTIAPISTAMEPVVAAASTSSALALLNGLDSTTAASTYLTIANAATTYAPKASPTFTGTVTSPTFSGEILGTATNNDATAGRVGEYISSTVFSGSAVSLTTDTAADITSISLTAGDWEVSGNGVYVPSSTSTNFLIWISTTSATVPTFPNEGGISQMQASFTSGAGQCFPCGPMRISLASTTTVYLSTLLTFAGTATAYGHIHARRVR